MQDFGNTSSSSIPLALVQNQSIARGLDSSKSLLVGFGTGFSISCLIADLSKTQYFGVFELDEN
jgi:3-oxoacyl-[acyl-carrier-protein] synthase III